MPEKSRKSGPVEPQPTSNDNRTPRAVLAVIGIAAAIVLYCDLRSFISEQAEAQEKTIRVLSEMSVRLQTIEHRMEVYHLQPPPVTKPTPPAE